MTLDTGNILMVGSILLFISIIAGKAGYKFGVPMLLLFLGEPFSQKDLDEANGKTLGDDANATDDGAKAA